MLDAVFLLLLLPALVVLAALVVLDTNRLWRRLGARIGPFRAADPWGLRAAITCVAMVGGLWLFLATVEDLVQPDPLVTLDHSIHAWLAAHRTPSTTRLMLVLSELGSPLFVWLLGLGAALVASSGGRMRAAAVLVVTVAAAGFFSVALKVVIGHPRPIDGIVTAHAASFPSGHMLGSCMMYGLLASLLMHTKLPVAARIAGALGFLLLVFGVGLSRVYLGVHWPSDLLGSVAVALFCMAPLLFFLRYEQPIPHVDGARLPISARAQRIGGALLIAVAFVSALAIAAHEKVTTPHAPHEVMLEEPTTPRLGG